MPTLRSALYLDFDNFFSGLADVDRTSALAAARQAGRWVGALADEGISGVGRRWLVRRCYLNPNGSADRGRPAGERVYFHMFREELMRAGFEVIDCPLLTARKNAADIKIVVDALTAVHGGAPLDEVVIVSSDSDFTPLLHALRAQGLETTILLAAPAADAFRAVADRVMDAGDLLDLLDLGDGEPKVEDAPEAPAPAAARNGGGADASWQQFVAAARSRYVAATTPLNTSRFAGELITELGQRVLEENWFGHGSFVRALRAAELPHAEFTMTTVWDPTRHEPPADAPVESVPVAASSLGDLRKLIGMPSLSPAQWQAVFRGLESFMALHEFSMAEAAKRTRDQTVASRQPVSRAAVNFAVKGVISAFGQRLGTETPTATEIAAGVRSAIRKSAADRDRSLSDAEVAELNDLLGVADREAAA